MKCTRYCHNLEEPNSACTRLSSCSNAYFVLRLSECNCKPIPWADGHTNYNLGWAYRYKVANWRHNWSAIIAGRPSRSELVVLRMTAVGHYRCPYNAAYNHCRSSSITASDLLQLLIYNRCPFIKAVNLLQLSTYYCCIPIADTHLSRARLYYCFPYIIVAYPLQLFIHYICSSITADHPIKLPIYYSCTSITAIHLLQLTNYLSCPFITAAHLLQLLIY